MVTTCGWMSVLDIPGWFGCETVEGSMTSGWYFPLAWIAVAVVGFAAWTLYKRRK